MISLSSLGSLRLIQIWLRRVLQRWKPLSRKRPMSAARNDSTGYACITLIDLATFPHLGFVAVICIFLIQIVALAALVRKYADENIAIAIDKIIASICDRFGWK